MSTQDLIFQGEVNGFLRKIESHYQVAITPIERFLQYPSAFRLISCLKKLTRKVIDLNKDTGTIDDEKVRVLYAEFQEIVIENFDEKKEITRQKKYRENYEMLFIFLVLFFKKVQII